MFPLPPLPDDCVIDARIDGDTLVLTWPKGMAYQPPAWLAKAFSAGELLWLIGGGFVLWEVFGVWYDLFLGMMAVWVFVGAAVAIALRIYWRRRRPATLVLTPKTLTFEPFRFWGHIERPARLLCAKANLSFQWGAGQLLLVERAGVDDLGFGLDEVDQEWLHAVLVQWLDS